MVCTSLCTIIIYQSAGRRVEGAECATYIVYTTNSAVAMMYITVYYHESARRSRRGGLLCYAHHRMLLIIIIHSARRRLCSTRGREHGRYYATYILPCTAVRVVVCNGSAAVCGSASGSVAVLAAVCGSVW
jgi:hypothetical protein